jgi:hypothetical protein
MATARFRYMNEDVHGAKGSRAFETYLQWTQRLAKRANFSVRYTLTQGLAGHPPTDLDLYCAEQQGEEPPEAEATPDGPTHSLWASFEVRF